MSNSKDEIESVQAEISELEETRRRVREPLDRFQVFVVPLDVDRFEKFRPSINQLQDVENRLSIAREKLVALELGSINSAIEAVKDSTAEQVVATSALKQSSRKLEAFTNVLIVLTAILAVVGSGSYILQAEKETGLSGQTALGYTYIGTLLVVLAFGISLIWVRRSYPDLTRSNERKPDES